MKKKSGLLYKTLVIGIIILFLGVTINPAVAEEDKVQKTDLEIEGNEKSSGRGFIVCYTRIGFPISGIYLPATLSLVICEDLDTGRLRFGITRFLGIHVFKFLPMGHNYKLNAYPQSAWDGEQTIYNLSYYDVATFSIELN